MKARPIFFILMDIVGGQTNSLIRSRRATPGWAAFDRLQKQKQGIDPKPEADNYPPISCVEHKKNLSGTCYNWKKSFSSVLQSEISQETGPYDRDERGTKNNHIVDVAYASPLGSLKKHHNWADDGLIHDILAAVNNDEEQAISFLKAMSSTCIDDDITSGHLDEINHPNNGTLECSNTSASYMAPLEPELEEEDIYLTHRKAAIHMLRTASKQSRAATNAFRRGDHSSAHKLATQAKETRAAAEILNAKAASEIIGINNSANNLWKLDLHGLHASEAVNFLKERLDKIEEQLSKPSTNSIRAATISTSDNRTIAQTHDTCRVSWPRSMTLLVITGTGKHSKEQQATLPASVRGFLIENRYNFNDARPGVFAVHPKFRCR